MKQDLDISNIQPKRKRVEQHKYDELVADLRETSRYADGLFQKLEQAVAELDRLKADNKQLKKDYDLSTNHVHEMTALYAKYERMSNKLRDQRDMARFIAALLGLAPFGFAVAVWLGKLIPVT